MEINAKYIHLLTLCHNITIGQNKQILNCIYSVLKYLSVSIGLIAASNDRLYFII